MKTAFSLFAAGALLLVSAFAQAPAPAEPAPAPVPAPAPATPPPAPAIEPPAVPPAPPAVAPAPAPDAKAAPAEPPKTAKKKTAPKKPATAKKAPPAAEPPDQPTPATVTGDRVNIRGRASLIGEVITQLRKGETITVLSETPLASPKPGEPAAWAKILLPTNVPVWIHASFVDPSTRTVKAARLNVRAGPGENFSIIGRLQRGDAYQPIRQIDDWIEIHTPPGTYGYVAANLIQKNPALASPTEPAAPASPAATPPPAPAETAGKETPPTPPATTTEPAPAVTPPPPTEPVTPAPPTVGDPPPPEPFVAPAPEPPPPRRVVTREGIVRHTVSLRAPSHYCLVDPDTDRVIAYLISDHADLNFRHLANQRMIFTGEEYLDARWRNRTVLKVETVEAAP
jgi:uncharacterized protein YgiM (DUF1202 family)